jgi:hypothetical protein
MEPYHTGLKAFGYEITISQRGGLGVATVHVHDRLQHETEDAFKQRLVTALLNTGISIAQSQIVHYTRRP